MMGNLGVCKTIGELRKVLEGIDDSFTWFGWDDGSIIICNKEGDEVAYIEYWE
jgi:hypothetical protein